MLILYCFQLHIQRLIDEMLIKKRNIKYLHKYADIGQLELV